MLTIQLNGETRETPSGTSVANLLEATGYADRKVAVEINREIVHALGGG